MSNQKGWVKIHRKLFKHFLWEENRKLSKFEAWLDILQLVSYAKENKQIISGVQCSWSRGQYPISISFLCNRWNWTEKPVRNFLKMLEKDKMVVMKRTSKWTMLTVCNYDSYQSEGQAEGQSKGNQEPIIKEYKELKEEYKGLILTWIDYRKQIKKPLTDNSIKKLCVKLPSEGYDKSKYIINLSIENGWQGLFWDRYQPTNKEKQGYNDLVAHAMNQVNMYKK